MQGLDVVFGTAVDVMPAAVTFLTALAALISALVSLATAKNQSIMVEASLWPDFSRRYKNDDMSEALQALVKWYHARPTDFVEEWDRLLKQDDAHAKLLDRHRRIVTLYFMDIANLYKDGMISKRFGRFVANQAGLNVFYGKLRQ
ncbi:MAG: hypothetical protein IPL62_17030 [Caulobacteraceae bacterium]|nr:hypothetical protein [Caulobacteraceae bacterium]